MSTLFTVNVGSSSVRIHAFVKQGGYYKRLLVHHQDHPKEGVVVDLPSAFHNLEAPFATIHRVVHGGKMLSSPCLLNEQSEAEIARLGKLAPLHHKWALDWIAICRRSFPKARQIGVFDTAFYRDLPSVAATYALPYSLCESLGIRRFGFHGLAHEGMWKTWLKKTTRSKREARIITLQLGSGCSITAIKGCQPIDTSMGFTPLEGLVMASRSGDVDAGLLLSLLRDHHYSLDELEALLNEQSGLLGISGISSDMRDLLDSQDPRAQLAIDIYCYRVRKYIGAYITILGGIDAILMGGGVGENAPMIRERILKPLDLFGIVLDPETNRQVVGTNSAIHAQGSNVEVWVTPTQEEDLLLAHASPLLSGFGG